MAGAVGTLLALTSAVLVLVGILLTPFAVAIIARMPRSSAAVRSITSASVMMLYPMPSEGSRPEEPSSQSQPDADAEVPLVQRDLARGERGGGLECPRYRVRADIDVTDVAILDLQ